MMSPHRSAAKHWSRVLAGQCFNVLFSDSIPQHNYAVHNSGGGKTVFYEAMRLAHTNNNCLFQPTHSSVVRMVFCPVDGTYRWQGPAAAVPPLLSPLLRLRPAIAKEPSVHFCVQLRFALKYILSLDTFCALALHSVILWSAFCKQHCPSQTSRAEGKAAIFFFWKTFVHQLSKNKLAQIPCQNRHAVPLHRVLQTDWYGLIEWNSM